jgi:hypothetical protein
MQTPIQTLIEKLEKLREPYVVNSGAWLHYSTALQQVRLMLPEEKEAIKEAFAQGYIQTQSAEDYYLTKYKNDSN